MPSRPLPDRLTRARPALGAALLVGTLLVLLLASLALGSRDLTLGQAWHGLLAHDTSVPAVIVWQLRLPRTLLALAAGAALAVAGVVMQALTRNPLAEPGVLGVSAGAALGVVIAIAALGRTSASGTLPFALLGAAVAAAMVYLLARRAAGEDSVRLLLAGVALAASLSSVTGTVTLYDSAAFDSYRTWVVGSLAGRDLGTLVAVSPALAAGLLLALGLGRPLNALVLGEETARALGVNVVGTRLLAFVTITLLCGGATAAVGPISFIGLVVPHIVRLMVGADQRHLLGWSLLAGPLLLLAADVVGRVLVRPAELEAGVVTAFIGAPVLIGLALGRRSA
ncbi:FecCD family ABC transporter permease [Actinomyces haliotis]|uniref:FecCD family ABC transporter permease n=1 Tax=Actinomyces haliotis TaxID=1280843 RepID=UPI0018904941|nr:iron chelate uptake ABC transporter family permease subunit [Actinomyces haliotis]